jgi:ribosomal protein S13
VNQAFCKKEMKQMMKTATRCIAILMLALLTGCTESAIQVNVNADGSGTILLNLYILKNGIARIEAMSEDAITSMIRKMGGDRIKGEVNFREDKEAIFFQKELWDNVASRMGEGVELTKLKRLSREDGAQGILAKYTFKDISQVIIQGEMLDPDVITDPPAPSDIPSEYCYTFKFKQQDEMSSLYITTPKANSVEEVIPSPEIAAEGLTPEQVEQIKGFVASGSKLKAVKLYKSATGKGLKDSIDAVEILTGGAVIKGPTPENIKESAKLARKAYKGVRKRFVVKVNEKTIKTNAKYQSKTTPSLITLYSIEFDKVLASTEATEILGVNPWTELQQIANQGISGLRYELPETEVEIQFK